MQLKNLISSIGLTGVILALGGAVCLAQEDLSRLPPAVDKTVDFTTDIQPLLQAKCLKCHGPEKPKSGFRLDNRESALKGGSEGVDIIPGNSADSPLIHFAAGLVEDFEMPPEGKGEPLTTGELALLRAWIDQGANWGGAEDTQKFKFSITPATQWLSVSGNAQKFREQTWLNEEWSGGLERFTAESWLDTDTKFTAEGRAITGPENYKFKMALERQDIGFLRGGVEHFRRYYNNYGGYYDSFNSLPQPDPALNPIFPAEPGAGELLLPAPAASYRLDRELHMDVGRVWGEVGFNRPLWPSITLGYEYRFKEGEKSTLHWGPSTQDGETRNIYPAFKYIKEDVHTFRADIRYELAGLVMENNFMAEYFELESRRFEASPLNFDAVPTTFTTIDETHESFQLPNTFSLQKEIKDWLMLSGGYYYSHLDADAGAQSRNLTWQSALPCYV
jgi:hypothetical protein